MRHRIRRPALAGALAAAVGALALASGCARSRAEYNRMVQQYHFKEQEAQRLALENEELRARRGPDYADTFHELFASEDSRPAARAPGRASMHAPVPWETTGTIDELWVIERTYVARRAVVRRKAASTQGELRARLEEREIPLPLEHTDVDARVSAFLATVKVAQRYRNPYDTKIEAVYVFPLPQSAAVTDFLMVVGERRIRGVIREREEARRIYEEARARGHVASLLTQERPNVFTQSVANIEPGKRIDVQITYFSPLRYTDGEYEFVFPMVVGPRFNPPGSTQGVGAAGRGARGRSGQATEIEYLRPGERGGHEVAVRLEIDAGVEIERVYSDSHAIRVERPAPERARVTLAPRDRIPNRDLVVRYRVAGRTLKTAMLTHRGRTGNYFALFLVPPADIASLPRMPREMVFVLDCSGSMSGRPLAKAKEAMRRCLARLDAHDTFQIIRFSERASRLGARPVPATAANVRKGLAYLEGLQSGGGTMMIEGVKAALDFPHEEERLRIVSFMTDGYIANESEILAAVAAKVGEARVFSFGVGSSVNRYLLERMAKLGRGAAAFVGLEDAAGREVDGFYERAARPALARIEIDWGALKVTDVYPKRVPDLFVGRPVLVVGRFEGSGGATVRVQGRAGGERRTLAFEVDPDAESAEHGGIAGLWARWRLMQLAERQMREPSRELAREITRVSLAHRVLSRYTAFLAVDSLSRTRGRTGVSVKVPVPVPDGVRYETTVEE